MKSFAFAGVIAAANAISEIELKYANYLAQFGKVINSVEEFGMRMENFAIVDEFIEEHNSNNSTHVAGHNQFSDFTRAEYRNMLGKKANEPTIVGKTHTFDESMAAASVNWKTAGAVTPVKDQAQCGSCWSFSATGALEGAHYIATGKLLSFSEQQLVSCSTANYGCNGGW
jgi:cathepsin L